MCVMIGARLHLQTSYYSVPYLATEPQFGMLCGY